MTGRLAAATLTVALLAAPASAQSARIIVVNGDPPGVGFNDPTPAAPVGGNPGTTVGQQALNVFQTAANRWAANLQSKQVISVVAFFTPLGCTATAGVLGAAAPYFSIRDVPPLPQGGKALEPGTFYPVALAEKLTRQEISEAVLPDEPFEIFTFFNSELGKPGCLTGNGWYYGLDNDQPGNRIDLLAVVMHEFGHGLGVTVGPTNAEFGTRAGGFPSVWERRMLDVTTGKRWIDMTDAERRASAINTGNLVWAGKQVTNVIPSVLDFQLSLRGSDIPNGEVLASTLGAALPRRFGGILVAPADGGGASPLDGCEPYPAASQVAGNIVLVTRGTCTFQQKAQVAQAAGAAGLVVANNVPGPFAIGGVDPTLTIPVLSTTLAYGATLRAAAPTAVSVFSDPRIRTGTTSGHARLFAPNPYQPGSSVSHFDTSLTPSVLMEPNITSELTSRVKNPVDLTLPLLRDIGW